MLPDYQINHPRELNPHSGYIHNNGANRGRGGKIAKRIFKWLGGLALVCLLFFVIFYLTAAFSGSKHLTWINNIPIIGTIKQIAESAEKPLKGEDRDRINILLLGVGGKGHDGAYLTDTIMVASIQPSTKKVALLSIPRDLSIPIEGHGWQKINAVDSYAEQAETNSGGIATSQAVSGLLNQPIDYYLRVDFTGFAKIIDDLGGVDVCVDNAFIDNQYPILGNEDAPWASRYQHLHFDAGCQHMDGSTALKFARSRHSYSQEGSDFARARRQQKIIEAAKAKGMSLGMLFKPQTVGQIISDLSDHILTNLQIWEIVKLASMEKNLSSGDITTKVLDNSPSGLLIDTVGLDGAYLLTPRSGNFNNIQYLFNNLFTGETAADSASQEKPTLQILNGTWINGLASKASLDLEKAGFTVLAVGNSQQQNFTNSVIYDLTNGVKTSSLAKLKEQTKANVSFDVPDWLKQTLASSSQPKIQPDFVLILGQDADITSSGINNPEK